MIINFLMWLCGFFAGMAFFVFEDAWSGAALAVMTMLLGVEYLVDEIRRAARACSVE